MSEYETAKQEREARVAERRRIAAIRAKVNKRDSTALYRDNRPFSMWADTRNDPR